MKRLLSILLIILLSIFLVEAQKVENARPSPKYILLYYSPSGIPILSAAGKLEQHWAIASLHFKTVEEAAEYATTNTIREEDMIGLYEVKASSKVPMEVKDTPTKPARSWKKRGGL